MAQRAGGEHRVQIQVRSAVAAVDEATPEKKLNFFIRFVALVERLGNALGTLAFTWATVVLLGGYADDLGPKNDFWFATAIVFLEAARMFSRNNRLDYQVFFYTRGAVRPMGWNGLLVVACLSSVLLNVFIILWKKHKQLSTVREDARNMMIIMLILTAAIHQIMSIGAAKLLSQTLRRSISLWSPLITIILLVKTMPYGNSSNAFIIIFKSAVFLLFLVVLLLTISRLRYPRIIELLDSALGRKLVYWRRVTLNWCIIFVLVIVVFVHVEDNPISIGLMLAYNIYALLLVSFGNLQFPVAVGRVVLALLRLVPHDYFGSGKNMNLGPSLCIFYGMVLGQGALYIIACLLEVFSFFPRRSLARRVGFRSQWGEESINLYYAYAFEKYMNGDVFASKRVSLRSFATDSIHSDLTKMQLHGVRILHRLLQREPSKTRLITTKLSTTSIDTMGRLIKMMDWTSTEDSTVRIFATKITVELSKSLRVNTIPGIVHIVSALLNNGNQHKREGNPLQDTNDEQDEEHDSIMNAADKITETEDGNLLQTQEDSTGQLRVQSKCWTLRCLQRIREAWAILEDEPLMEQDLLPALGMIIIDNLATYDQENCLEINRASGLIQKIIEFTRYCRSDTTYTDTQRNILAQSSLRLLRTLTSINGEIGTTLQHNISRHRIIFINLAKILRNNTCNRELRTLAVGILRNLAVDVNIRQVIGRSQVIINRLMQIFLMPDEPSSTNSDPLLRKVAGQALAMLAMDSVDNCLTMLRETRIEFIKELTCLIHLDRYRCVSASLLRSMCHDARHNLKVSDLKELSHALREVLERILVANRTELEILVGLSSQICKAIPDDFAKELELGQMTETFVKLLVDALYVDIELNNGCLGISRSIIEQAIHMMEYDSGYATYFNDHHMTEALSMVEEMDSVNGEPMSSLLARAKMLLTCQLN